MSLQRNFPRERKFYFWAIFFSHMLANDDATSETDKKLFGTLAYRMISKAAADVPADPVSCLYVLGARVLSSTTCRFKWADEVSNFRTNC